jgi:thiol-disulfide isomerase/thioredoxin
LRALIACLPLTLLIAGCDTQPAQPPQAKGGAKSRAVAQNSVDRSKKGSEAPIEPFATLDGKAVSLTDYRGKPLLINLWATWCAPCVKELPGLDRIATREAGRMTVLAISQDMDAGTVPAWWTARGFKTLTTQIDKEGKLPFSLDTGTLPTTVLYDANGREVWRMVGERDWDAADVPALLREAGAS